ncbi:MAG: T9SS type A sorting domain-containing protein [Chitinophagales bacterium]|nr:T9SS type A sorting domain-containing protein [Chitinophagales bacterium]
MKNSTASLFLLLFTAGFTQKLAAQAWKAYNIVSGNPNNVVNESRYITASTGATGVSIATSNGIPAGNNNLPYGAAFDPTEGKLYYSKAGTVASTSVFNVFNNTGASSTNTNLSTIAGGEFFRMGVGQDGNVYGTLANFVANNSDGIPMYTQKLTRYNPTTNVFSVLGNLQCPAAYASLMPVPYNTGDYWSVSPAATPSYAASIGNANYGDMVASPDNTMYITIGKKILTIPNYASLSGTAQIPTVELGNVLPAGVGFSFGSGFGTYGISWDYNSGNLFLISSRTSDGRDGSFLLNPATLALVGAFNIGPSASSNFADLTEVLSSVGAAKQLTGVQWLGYNNRYRLTYRIRIENIGTSILKNVQVVENLQTAFPALTISNVTASFISNPASLVLNALYNGTTNTNLLDGTKILYGPLYNGANLNGGAGTITAGSNSATIDVTFDVDGVATNGTTTYNNTAAANGTAFDGTSVADNSDNGTAVESGTANFKADEAGEGDATPIKFGSTVSGTVWNDANGSANNTFLNIFTTGESGTNASGLNAILTDPVTNLVIASVPVASNGTYTFNNVPSFANLQVRLSTTAGVAGSAPPAGSLPPGWTSTSPLSTNATGDINTGTYSAADAIRFGASDDINNDFGIEQLPESNTQSYTIATPSVGSSISLNGTGAPGSPGPLTGSDPEDQPVSGSLSGKTVAITQLPANSELWYNGVRILLGTDGINPPSVSNPFVISGYNPALLEVRITGATLGSMSTAFNYAYVDAAGKIDPSPAIYTVNWSGALPARLQFTVIKSGTTALLKWIVLNEHHVSQYELERSADGRTFTSIYTVTHSGAPQYSYRDEQPLAGVNYYHVKITDLDGRISYSEARIIIFGNNGQIAVFPNPALSGNTVHFQLPESWQGKPLDIELIAQSGQVLIRKKVAQSSTMESIGLTNIPSGYYLLRLRNGRQPEEIRKFVVQ